MRTYWSFVDRLEYAGGVLWVDNVTLNSGTSGATAAADDIGGVHHQRVKISVGADGTANDAIPVSNGLDTTATGVLAAGLVAQLDDTATGTVTENQFAPVRMSTRRALLVEGVASGTVVPISDGGGNLSIDDGGNVISVDWNGTAPPIGAGTEAAALRVTLATDSTGVVSVDDNGGTLTVDNAALSVTGGGVEATALRVTLASDSTGVLSVDDNGGALTVDGTVTAEQATAANLNATVVGTGTFAVQNTAQASTNTQEMVGDVAHDAAAAGNPVLVCGVAQNNDDTAPPNRVSAESDATRLATDLDGSLHVRTHGPQIWSYHENSSSALTDTQVHAAPAAGLSLYVTDIIVSTGAATALNFFLEEGASTVFGPIYLEAVAGRGFCHRFVTPKKITAATALTITTSAAIAHAIDITGFVAQG